MRALLASAGKRSPSWRAARDLRRSLRSAPLTKRLPALVSCSGEIRREISLRLKKRRWNHYDRLTRPRAEMKRRMAKRAARK